MFISQRVSVSLALLRFFFCIHCDTGHFPSLLSTVKGIGAITPVYPLRFFISLSIFWPPLLCVATTESLSRQTKPKLWLALYWTKHQSAWLLY
jgi:hypothetical protein